MKIQRLIFTYLLVIKMNVPDDILRVYLIPTCS